MKDVIVYDMPLFEEEWLYDVNSSRIHTDYTNIDAQVRVQKRAGGYSYVNIHENINNEVIMNLSYYEKIVCRDVYKYLTKFSKGYRIRISNGSNDVWAKVLFSSPELLLMRNFTRENNELAKSIAIYVAKSFSGYINDMKRLMETEKKTSKEIKEKITKDFVSSIMSIIKGKEENKEEGKEEDKKEDNGEDKEESKKEGSGEDKEDGKKECSGEGKEECKKEGNVECKEDGNKEGSGKSREEDRKEGEEEGEESSRRIKTYRDEMIDIIAQKFNEVVQKAGQSLIGTDLNVRDSTDEINEIRRNLKDVDFRNKLQKLKTTSRDIAGYFMMIDNKVQSRSRLSVNDYTLVDETLYLEKLINMSFTDMTRSKRISFDLYLDSSGSMSNVKKAKAILVFDGLKRYSCMIGNKYVFDTKVAELNSIDSFKRISGGGTKISKVFEKILKRNKPSLIITDMEDNSLIKYYETLSQHKKERIKYIVSFIQVLDDNSYDYYSDKYYSEYSNVFNCLFQI